LIDDAVMQAIVLEQETKRIHQIKKQRKSKQKYVEKTPKNWAKLFHPRKKARLWLYRLCQNRNLAIGPTNVSV